jgi:hypothetical protein
MLLMFGIAPPLSCHVTSPAGRGPSMPLDAKDAERQKVQLRGPGRTSAPIAQNDTEGPAIASKTAAGDARVTLSGLEVEALTRAAPPAAGQRDEGTGKGVGKGRVSVVGVAAPDAAFDGQVDDVEPWSRTKDALGVTKLQGHVQR